MQTISEQEASPFFFFCLLSCCQLIVNRKKVPLFLVSFPGSLFSSPTQYLVSKHTAHVEFCRLCNWTIKILTFDSSGCGVHRRRCNGQCTRLRDALCTRGAMVGRWMMHDAPPHVRAVGNWVGCRHRNATTIFPGSRGKPKTHRGKPRKG